MDALERLGLALGDIRGLTTDGCTTIRKVEVLLTKAAARKPFYYQQCFARALHLAVGGTLHVEDEPEASTEEHHEEQPEASAAIHSWRFV